MYKLKYKMLDSLQSMGKFETLQEVADKVSQLVRSDDVATALKIQKDLQIRVYVARKNDDDVKN